MDYITGDENLFCIYKNKQTYLPKNGMQISPSATTASSQDGINRYGNWENEWFSV